ncbi:MAG: hypothetical protein QXJ00_06085 [Candidatus Nezhaarchaeales archaeon]
MSKIEKVELKDAKPYEAPKHFNMVALRLHSRDTTGTQKFWVGLSHFLPAVALKWMQDLNEFTSSSQGL